ncbi:uncharacterized protein [Venturia canescens]|nr:uncharacterized protein LOC122408493 [Venturia canescens]
MTLYYEDYVSPSDPLPHVELRVYVTDGVRRVELVYDDTIHDHYQHHQRDWTRVQQYRRGATEIERRENAARSRALKKRREAKKLLKRKAEPSSWIDVTFPKRNRSDMDLVEREEKKKLKWRLIPFDFESPRPPNIRRLENELKRVAILESDEEAEEEDP